MLTRSRVFSFALLLISLSVMTMPLAVKHTSRVTPVLSVLFLCVILAFHLERTLTFRLIKKVDKLEWVNDMGLGPIYLLVKMLTVLMIAFCIGEIWKDFDGFNLFVFAYVLVLPALMDANAIYIGEHYIYTQGSYIPIDAITTYETKALKAGKHRQAQVLAIRLNEKCYHIRYRQDTRQGIDTLILRLEQKSAP